MILPHFTCGILQDTMPESVLIASTEESSIFRKRTESYTGCVAEKSQPFCLDQSFIFREVCLKRNPLSKHAWWSMHGV